MFCSILNIKWQKCLFNLMNIRCWNVASDRQQRPGGNIFPPRLNILSTGAQDTGGARYFIANVDRQGKEIISLFVYTMLMYV